MAQEMVLGAIQAHAKAPQTHPVGAGGGPEVPEAPCEDPGPHQAFLEGFLAWNPFTAAALAASDRSMRQLLQLSEVLLAISGFWPSWRLPPPLSLTATALLTTG